MSRDVGAHQVDIDVARVQRAKDELRDFAHRADRRRIGLARHATGDKRQPEGQTAITVSQTGMPKLACPSQASATSDTIWPTANQLMGASMRSGSLAAAERKESICPRSWNALNAVASGPPSFCSSRNECGGRIALRRRYSRITEAAHYHRLQCWESRPRQPPSIPAQIRRTGHKEGSRFLEFFVAYAGE